MYVNTIYKEMIRKNFNKKYNDDKLFERHTNPYVSIVIESLIENRNTQYCARYRDCMIYDYIDEFLKRFYAREESTARLPGIAKYYKSYLKFMCKPTLRNFRANDLLHLYADQKAELYQCVNYESKNRTAKEKIKYQTILTETVKENLNENIITRSEVDCEDLLFHTESIAKDGVSLSLDEHSLALLGLNDHLISHRSNNKEESLLFLLGKFEDRKLNDKFVKKNVLFNDNRQKTSNYDKTTKDYSIKTVKEHTSNDKLEEKKKDNDILVAKEGKEVKVSDIDLKMKLKNMIQDINGITKTRNRNVYNQIAVVSLSKENSKTNTQNKTNIITNSFNKNKRIESNKKIGNISNKLKFYTFQSKYAKNPSEMNHKLQQNSIKPSSKTHLKNLDFHITNSNEAKIMFKSHHNENTEKNINTIKRIDNKIHKTYDIKYLQSKERSDNNNNNPTVNIKKQLAHNFKNISSKVKEQNKNIKQNTQNNNNDKTKSIDSKLLDNLYLFSTRIQSNLEKNQMKSRNPTHTLNHDKSTVNKNDQQNAATKSYKINLNYPSNYEDLRNKIYGSLDGNKFMNNIITVTSTKLTNRRSDSKDNKSPINYLKKKQPQILIKNKTQQNKFENKKKSDSTCDKSNHVTYNSLKTKEICSSIAFPKNSEEKIYNIKKEKITSPCINNNCYQLSPKANFNNNVKNKVKINLINSFNTCSYSYKQHRIVPSSKNSKFRNDNYEKNKQN